MVTITPKLLPDPLLDSDHRYVEIFILIIATIVFSLNNVTGNIKNTVCIMEPLS